MKKLAKLGFLAARLHLFDTDRKTIDRNSIAGHYLLGSHLTQGKGNEGILTWESWLMKMAKNFLTEFQMKIDFLLSLVH